MSFAGLRPARSGLCAALAAACALLVPPSARASGPRLSIQEAEASRQRWPEARVFVEVVGASGAPIQGLAPELFQVYEGGRARSAKVIKVQTIEEARAGASVVVVLQTSGSWMAVEEGVKKALSGFVQGLAPRDRVAIVTDSGDPRVLAGFSEDKHAQAGALGQAGFADPSFLLYDGVALALSLFDGPGPGGRGGVETGPGAPPPRAVVVVADGRDNGSSAGAETVIAEALRRRVPIHAVGHSELSPEGLPALEQLAARTSGAFRAAPAVEDLGDALTAVRARIDKTYAIAWKTELPHDGKEHQIEVALENEGGAPLRGKLSLRTPPFTDWRWPAVCAGLLLAAGAVGAAAFVLARSSRGAAPGGRSSGAARLRVRTGDRKGQVHPLSGRCSTLGSGPDAQIRLLDPAVSGAHAAIRAAAGGRFEIEDLGSRNGVLVNGRRTLRCELHEGDLITLGTTELSFELTAGGGG